MLMLTWTRRADRLLSQPIVVSSPSGLPPQKTTPASDEEVSRWLHHEQVRVKASLALPRLVGTRTPTVSSRSSRSSSTLKHRSKASNHVPPCSYGVLANAATPPGRPIMCLLAPTEFSRMPPPRLDVIASSTALRIFVLVIIGFKVQGSGWRVVSFWVWGLGFRI